VVPVQPGDVFSYDQRTRLDEAATNAGIQSGMRFVCFVGPLPEPDGTPAHEPASAHAAAAAMLARLTGPEEETVLIAVAPEQRQVQVVTSAHARHRLPDQACALATLSMTTNFAVGDLTGGLITGLRMLADATLPALPEHGRPESTASTVTHPFPTATG